MHSKYAGPRESKKKKPIPKMSAKKIAAAKTAKEGRAGKETDLQEWYAKIMKDEKPVCWETGEEISKGDVKGWHGSIAHILPKKLFPSVSTHPMNYLILKMWGGTHARYDLSWESAQKMKVWPLAVDRFLQFANQIADNEMKYLPNCLLEKLVNSNEM
jgi:hypothetical protein